MIEHKNPLSPHIHALSFALPLCRGARLERPGNVVFIQSIMNNNTPGVQATRPCGYLALCGIKISKNLFVVLIFDQMLLLLQNSYYNVSSV